MPLRCGIVCLMVFVAFEFACEYMHAKCILNQYIYILYISWACWFGIIFRLFNQLPKFIYN